MKTMNLFVSLNNFNNQAEYDAYQALPIEDHAQEDFELTEVISLTVGYSKIVIVTRTDDENGTRKTIMDRKIKTGSNYWSARSIAVNGKAFIMHGPHFKPFTAVPAADGFEIAYRTEGAKND